ncbi:carboxypeptidase regulatory-like domain-containing protein [Candidatus Bathyarchaeota archaeon]|nr:carboxypeptidase regulatory-like domain-containing protein [Candidatus Bathyarchaeota archaeon]
MNKSNLKGILIVGFTLCLLFINLTTLADTSYSGWESVVIHEDGTITPSTAPIIRNGNLYTFTADVYIQPSTTNEGLIIMKDNVKVDGAGHQIKGSGQGSAILIEELEGVTLTGFQLKDFYWGLEIRESTKCTIYGNNLSAVNYPLYIYQSSNNLIYHNNILGPLNYEGSSNTWDNGYPSGGNYWIGYPFPDEKKGPDQTQPGSDGIGDVKVDEVIFSSGGINVDNYPLINEIKLRDVGTPPIEGEDSTTGLKIIVRDDKGDPLQGAAVVSTEQPSGQTILNGLTDDYGVVTFEDIIPGDYTLKISKRGYVEQISGGEVPIGEHIEGEFTLEAQIEAETGEETVVETEEEPEEAIEEEKNGVPGFSTYAILLGLILSQRKILQACQNRQ